MSARQIWVTVIGTAALSVAITSGCDGRRGENASSSSAPAHPEAAPQAATSQTGLPAAAAGATPTDSTASSQLRERLGPFTIDGANYFVDIERYVSAPDTGVRRLFVRDTGGRVLFEENVAALVPPSDSSWKLMEASAALIEDVRGRSRALQFTYLQFVSAAVEEADVETRTAVRFVAPRSNVVKPIAPILRIHGRPDTLPSGSLPGSRRLLEGNRFIVRGWRYHFAAILPYHVDLECTTGAEACVTLVAPDSIAGHVRFRVDVEPDRITSSTTIDLCPVPGGTPERMTLDGGTEVEVLEGATLALDAFADWTKINEDWLLVRVNGRTGWISERDLDGIGLVRRL